MSTLSADFEKSYPGGPTIRVKFERPADEFSATILFGPSGSGKTTILRCLAGLERPDRGRILCDGTPWLDTSAGVFLQPQARGIGFLFQDYALFPHMTVAENIRFGLRGVSRSEQRRRVAEMLDMLGLAGIEARYPRQLSGGEQQRVALARAVARRPRLLLLDEPLSALDTDNRERLRRELRRILAQFAIPCFIVTHDRFEAMSLGDHMLVLERGEVLQDGPAAEVFSRPAHPRVASMVGVETVLPARLIRVEQGLATVDAGGVQLTVVAPPAGRGEVLICIRGEDVTLQRQLGDGISARNQLPGRIVSLAPEGGVVRVELDCGFRLVAVVTRPALRDLDLKLGDNVLAAIKAPAIHVIARNG
jgi:molybdate transport system ATP-binding protein